MRPTSLFFDKTKASHKYYKYGYQPDPRKFYPADRISKTELFPTIVRPPCSRVRTTDEFLEKIDYHIKYPASEFKTAFSSWNDLMTATDQNMMKRGIPPKVARFIQKHVGYFTNGLVPLRFDAKGEQRYWKQFKTINGAHVRWPELPDKYRPHQLGEDVPRQPNYAEMNRLPDWARQS